MERTKPQRDPQKWEQLERSALRGGLIGALAGCAANPYDLKKFNALWDTLTGLYGKDPARISREEFFCPELQQAFTALAGAEMAQKFPGILDLRLQGPFSSGPLQRSYRSRNFAYYADQAVRLMCQLIALACHRESVTERLFCDDAFPDGFEYPLAYALKNEDQEIAALLHEALMGDNRKILLTRSMIEAIVISGHPALMDDLMDLLLAARLQEGLRQQILESADKGPTAVLVRIMKVCLDAGLFRYSSAIRAFDTWTGLGYGDGKPQGSEQFARTACECLTDDAKRRACLESGSNTDAYFALWAMGCIAFEDVHLSVHRLLEDPRPYRRVLAWLFVSRTYADKYCMSLAAAHLQERDEELLAWIVRNLVQTRDLLRYRWDGRPTESGKGVPNDALPADRQERRALFFRLKEVAAFIGNKKRTFTGNPFEFVTVTLENQRVYGCMIALAGYDMDEELTQQLLELAPNMSPDQRYSLLCFFLRPQKNAAHRKYLHSALGDRSGDVRELAAQLLGACPLTDEDLSVLAGSLRSKSSSLRAAVMAVLQKQSASLLSPLVSRMLQAPEEHQNQAAVELLTALKDREPRLLQANRPALFALQQKQLSTQTRILLDQLLPAQQEVPQFAPENGFGLYDPRVVGEFVSSQTAPGKKPGLLARLRSSSDASAAKKLRAMLITEEDLNQLTDRMVQVFSRHADEEIEVEWYDGSRHLVLFGDPDAHQIRLPVSSGCRSLNDPNARLDMIPFWPEFHEALGVYTRDVQKMLGLYLRVAQIHDPASIYPERTYCAWYQTAAELTAAIQHPRTLRMHRASVWNAMEIFRHLPSLFDAHDVFQEVLALYRDTIALLGEKNLSVDFLKTKKAAANVFHYHPTATIGINCPLLSVWRGLIRALKLGSQDFAQWFTLEYCLEYSVKDDVYMRLETPLYFRAFAEQLIPKDVLVAFLMDPVACMPRKMTTLTGSGPRFDSREIYDRYPFARELVRDVLDRCVAVEEKRGELPTPLTGHCRNIERFEGAGHFCALLAALGKEHFFRGYDYSGNDTKQAVLSRLLKRCWPAKEDTPERLAALLKATDISEKRLAEAVMYAPQWAGFAEKILGWPGLKCGVWFFHAHINETFSAEKETETAIFSPITPQQFNDGAFDKHWFFEAYNQLGEKRFQILYSAAKHITAGSNQHRRSQLYADAVLDRLDEQALLQEITEKRNQEKLRCYSLIPLKKPEDALLRYAFIQKFLKESKQFGAQRRDSEKKACATAMENLAITTGIMDVNRLMWQMESRKFDQIRPLMEPVTIDGVALRLTVDDRGDAGVLLEKDGKALKTIPKALAKNETLLQLKDTVKELWELKRRCRESLERAMTDSTVFGSAELQNICTNPILAPMVEQLMWTDGEKMGFLEQFEGASGLRIAHPHDLKQSGQWASFMRLLYERQLVQPFKQVFREYYPITEDERQERTISRRYAGHQVQPQRTVALLKARGWTVDYEEGLQKVFYKENLIVRMFALADWFSPADIEPPTLETVEFFDRKTEAPMALADVPPILFSETMRDLDLVVSVAHVGGVDPEASHSTTQMRTAIAAELLRLLGISNVSWIGVHAKIRGTLANYSVHMGSGIVHAEGVGMVAILPVHSQARGRIFLPFADDDPKTAEILSKILLLAQDQKIKDPSILGQITG